MTFIKNIANKIHKSIQVTIDYPSNYTNGRMPVLDLEQWIEEVEVEGNSKYQILHSHYMKNIASQNVINKESALSMQSKISILVSDLVRVMRNVSVQCNGEEKSKHVQQFIYRMQFSGYSQEDKVLVYKKAKRVFDNIIEHDRVGQCPIYRSKFWQRRERDKRHFDKRCNWYKTGDHETVMSVQATPNGKLAKAYRKAQKEAGLKLRVVE